MTKKEFVNVLMAIDATGYLAGVEGIFQLGLGHGMGLGWHLGFPIQRGKAFLEILMN